MGKLFSSHGGFLTNLIFVRSYKFLLVIFWLNLHRFYFSEVSIRDLWVRNSISCTRENHVLYSRKSLPCKTHLFQNRTFHWYSIMLKWLFSHNEFSQKVQLLNYFRAFLLSTDFSSSNIHFLKKKSLKNTTRVQVLNNLNQEQDWHFIYSCLIEQAFCCLKLVHHKFYILMPDRAFLIALDMIIFRYFQGIPCSPLLFPYLYHVKTFNNMKLFLNLTYFKMPCNPKHTHFSWSLIGKAKAKAVEGSWEDDLCL